MNDIAEDLSTVYDNLEQSAEAEASSTSSEADSLNSEEEYREETEGEESQLSGDDDQQGSEQQQEQQQEQQNIVEAPIHWPAQDRERFAELAKLQGAEWVQDWLLGRHNDLEKAFYEKSQGIADFKRTWDPVQEMFAPYIAQGINPTQTVMQWANIANNLQQNPRETLSRLAQQYGVDFSQQEGEQQGFIDPNVQKLEQQIHQLTNYIQQQENNAVQTSQQQRLTEIQDFATQKTEAGEPAHPYFDEVIQEVTLLARAERQAGRQPNLKSLYEQAIWSNPTVREKILTSQRQAEAKKREQEAIAKAKRAQQASKSISGAPSGEAPTEGLSVRQELEAGWPG